MNITPEDIPKDWKSFCTRGHEIVVEGQYGIYAFKPELNDPVGIALLQYGGFGLDFLLPTLDFLNQQYPITAGKRLLLNIGANIGTTCIQALMAEKVDLAIGIEPDPTHYHYLQKNIALNNLQNKIHGLKLAASNQKQTVQFIRSTANTADHHISAPNEAILNKQDANIIQVQALTLDQIARTLSAPFNLPPHIIWLDVQGHEGYVFKGSPGMFSKDIPVVAEVNPSTILRSGLSLDEYCSICTAYWNFYWLHTTEGIKQEPISSLKSFLEYLQNGIEEYDIIYTKN